MVFGKAIAKPDVVQALAFNHHIGPADSVRLLIVVLTEDLQAGIGVEFPKVLLRYRKHSAGATCRVPEGLDNALGGQPTILCASASVRDGSIWPTGW